MIYIGEDKDETYKVEQFTFPGGEVGVKLPMRYSWSDDCYDIFIEAIIKNSDDVMALLLTVDAAREYFTNDTNYHLALKYVPYARQDRVTVGGESLSIRVFAKLINSCGFQNVLIYDPHSDVTPALINNVTVVSQDEIFENIIWQHRTKNRWIVAPDLGAHKKAEKFAKHVFAEGVITCTKVRDPSTGKLSNYRCYDDVKDLDVVVLDDILDGGGTFHLVADALDAGGAKSKILCVTHGIFSKGLNGLTERFDHIYTTTSFYGSIENVPDELKNDKITWME